jgi:hypothetical protein
MTPLTPSNRAEIVVKPIRQMKLTEVTADAGNTLLLCTHSWNFRRNVSRNKSNLDCKPQFPVLGECGVLEEILDAWYRFLDVLISFPFLARSHC